MKTTYLTVALLFSIFFSHAQGCSDAGICSINHGFQEADKQFKNTFEVATIYSLGEADLKYFSPYVAYTRRFSDQFSLSSRVTFSASNGSLGSISQLGDAFLIGNYKFKAHNNKQWSTLLGFKLPFNNSNTKANGVALPLDYQSSLGTIDLFVGTNLNYKRWDFNGAIQVPVFNFNENTYFSTLSTSTDFVTTNKFERKPDALLRAIYTLQVPNKKFTFKPNVLFIYHLGKDSFENLLGERQTISGSDGITVNGNLITSYRISKQSSLELSLASPFVVRTARPDGLTRSFVAGLQYQYSF